MRTPVGAFHRFPVQALIPTSAILLLWGCQPDAFTAEESGSGTVTGVVAAAKTAEGVANLVVVLVRDGRAIRSTVTSEEGTFRFGGLAAGPYEVALAAAELAGLSTLHTVFTPTRHHIEVANATVDLTFAVVNLVPARIVGEVSCGRHPAVDARLRVVGGSTDTVVATDAVGRYGATDLAPGSYTVTAVEVPCRVGRGVEVVSLRAGQSLDVDFGGR